MRVHDRSVTIGWPNKEGPSSGENYSDHAFSDLTSALTRRGSIDTRERVPAKVKYEETTKREAARVSDMTRDPV